MANNFTSNPWIIDTPAVTILCRDLLRVKGIRWIGATTAAHQAICTDQNGKVKWEGVATGVNNSEGDDVSAPLQGANWDGLIVPTLGSGRLYIELL